MFQLKKLCLKIYIFTSAYHRANVECGVAKFPAFLGEHPSVLVAWLRNVHDSMSQQWLNAVAAVLPWHLLCLKIDCYPFSSLINSEYLSLILKHKHIILSLKTLKLIKLVEICNLYPTSLFQKQNTIKISFI